MNPVNLFETLFRSLLPVLTGCPTSRPQKPTKFLALNLRLNHSYYICHLLTNSLSYRSGSSTNRSMLHVYMGLSADYNVRSQRLYRLCKRAVLLLSAKHHAGVGLWDHHWLLRDDKIRNANPLSRGSLCSAWPKPPHYPLTLPEARLSGTDEKRIAPMSHSM